MNKFVFSVCLFLFSLAGFAQGSTLVEAEEDSTISVIAYFCKNDSLVYDYWHVKNRIKEADTVTTVNVTTRFLVTVTDSTREGDEMVLVPKKHRKGRDHPRRRGTEDGRPPHDAPWRELPVLHR